MNKAMALVVLSVLPAVGAAQVVTPVPPKNPAPPAWTPPPPPPPAPTPPVVTEPDVATPDIVKRDAEGRLIWPALTPEQVVFEAIPLDEGQRKAWNEKWSGRQAQMDALILSELPEVIKLFDTFATIDQEKDWSPIMSLSTPINKSLALKPSLEQFIKTSQVLRPKQLAAFSEGIANFRKQTTDDLQKRTGKDQAKMMLEGPRDAAKARAQEGLIALNRMAAALAQNWAKTKGALNLTGDFSAAEAQAAKATDDKSKAAAGIALLKAVPAERQAEVLGTFRTPMPAAPQPPADPAKTGVDMPKIPAAKPPVAPPPAK